jgi:mono/diheme cytochrome c family protein
MNSRIMRPLAVVVMGGGLLLAGNAMAADALNGSKLYNQQCAGCHGNNGHAQIPGVPDFQRSRALMQPDADLVKKIETGAGVMPAFRGLLTTQEILDVIAHIRTFY